MARYRIGIDPDVDKSGVCLIDTFLKKVVSVEALDLFDTVDFINKNSEATVCIEAGWKNKKTEWHSKPGMNSATTAKIGSFVGANHEIGKQLYKYCIKKGRDVKLYVPSSKKWDARTFKMVTKYTGRTNQEQRDAVRAAWK